MATRSQNVPRSSRLVLSCGAVHTKQVLSERWYPTVAAGWFQMSHVSITLHTTCTTCVVSSHFNFLHYFPTLKYPPQELFFFTPNPHALRPFFVFLWDHLSTYRLIIRS
jgi:hypothetical protein